MFEVLIDPKIEMDGQIPMDLEGFNNLTSEAEKILSTRGNPGDWDMIRRRLTRMGIVFSFRDTSNDKEDFD